MRIVGHKGKVVGVGTLAVKISEEHVGGREAPEVAQIDEILIKVNDWNPNPSYSSLDTTTYSSSLTSFTGITLRSIHQGIPC